MRVRRVTPTKRYHSTIKLPPYPRPNQLVSYMVQVGRVLVSASPYADGAEYEWIRETTVPGTTFDTLGDSGDSRFFPLDTLLACALLPMLPHHVRMNVQRKEEMLYKDKKQLTGRQIVFMVRETFRT